MRQSRVPFSAGQFMAQRENKRANVKQTFCAHEWNFPHDNLQQNISRSNPISTPTLVSSSSTDCCRRHHHNCFSLSLII